VIPRGSTRRGPWIPSRPEASEFPGSAERQCVNAVAVTPFDTLAHPIPRSMSVPRGVLEEVSAIISADEVLRYLRQHHAAPESFPYRWDVAVEARGLTICLTTWIGNGDATRWQVNAKLALDRSRFPGDWAGAVTEVAFGLLASVRMEIAARAGAAHAIKPR
jgi:hypothetical protein